MAACFNLLSQMIAGIVGLCSLGDLNPLVFAEKRLGEHLSACQRIGTAGEGSHRAWEGGIFQQLGHRVTEGAVHPWPFPADVSSGFFQGVSCVCCVWEAVLGQRAAGRFSCMAGWSLQCLCAQMCPLLRAQPDVILENASPLYL